MRFLLLILVLLVNVFSFKDGNGWELQKNENGVQIYTRPTSYSKIKEVKVVNMAKSSLSGIVALLLDTKNYTNWINGCKEGRTLKVVSDQEIYKYQLTNTPWPVDDRDAVSDFKISQDPQTKKVTITDVSTPDYIPVKEGVVRIRNFKATEVLMPFNDGNVKVEYELFLDPGGNIPDWLINEHLTETPCKNTIAMLQQLPKYQSVKYPFIKE